jgi:hypothetical protein
MRYVVVAVLIVSAAMAVPVLLGTRRPPVASAAIQTCPQCERLSEQIDALLKSQVATESRLAELQGQLNANAKPVKAPTTAEKLGNSPLEEAQEIQSADQERNRTYMTEVAQSFNNERSNPSWATQVTSRVNTTLANDEALRGSVYTVDCRQQTCRVQIEDDGSGRVTARLPSMTRELGDVLPTFSAEQIDAGNGHRATVLYMSSQSSARPMQNHAASGQ